MLIKKLGKIKYLSRQIYLGQDVPGSIEGVGGRVGYYKPALVTFGVYNKKSLRYSPVI
jgi:hypothetical protein